MAGGGARSMSTMTAPPDPGSNQPRPAVVPSLVRPALVLQLKWSLASRGIDFVLYRRQCRPIPSSNIPTPAAYP
jgi:hypothetical protein